MAVPQYRQQVQAQPLKLPMQDGSAGSPEAFGALEGKGLQNLGTGINNATEDAGRVLMQINRENMQRTAKQTDNEYTRYVSDLLYGDGTEANPGYLAQQGQNALDNFSSVHDAMAKKKEELASKIGNQTVKDMFTSSAEVLTNSALQQMGGHASQQRIVANDVASEARIGNARSLAASAGRDPNILNQALDMVEVEIRDKSKRHGYDEQATNDLIVQQQSKVYEAAITGVMVTNTDLAMKMFNDSKDNMDGITAAQTATKLEAKHKQDISDMWSNETHEHTRTLLLQEKNASELTVRVAQKTLTQDELVDWLAKSRITREQYSTILTYMTAPPKIEGSAEKTNNYRIAGWQGTLDIKTVMADPDVSDKQKTEIIGVWAQTQVNGGPLARNDVKNAMSSIKNVVGGILGPLDRLTGQDALRVDNAISQFTAAIQNTAPTALNTEEINKLRQQAIDTWKTDPIVADVFSNVPNPRYWVGSKFGNKATLQANFAKSKNELIKSFGKGEISEAERDKQIDILNMIEKNINLKADAPTTKGK